jgi:hypothetical protein
MKNSYLNSMLNFGVEVGVIQKKKQKNTLLIYLRKEEKKTH